MLDVSVKVPLEVPHTRPLDAIWSGAEWENRWECVSTFNVLYDDGAHQIVTISFDWDGETKEIKVTRFRLSPTCIEFFCQSLPTPLEHQVGRWKIETDGERHFLVAERALTLASAEDQTSPQRYLSQKAFTFKLAARLSRILTNFSKAKGGELCLQTS